MQKVAKAQSGDMEYLQLGPGLYQKWNPILRIRSTVRVWHEGGKKYVTVKHEQPKADIKAILDRNVAIQNDFGGYKNKQMYQGTSLPITVHKQVMKACGFKPGQGYDEKKFKQIINDRDYYKLKTVPGKI